MFNKDSLKAILISTLLLFGGMQHARSDELLLGPGDVVRATVYGHPDLSAVSRIGDDGTMTFPLIGNVKIGGLTTGRAEALIAERLVKGNYVKEAEVSIFVEQRQQTLANSVVILGQVGQPGRYPLQGVAVEGVQSVVDLLAAAGGPNENAGDRIIMFRTSSGELKKAELDLARMFEDGELQQNVKLTGGDIVYVPEADVFYIFGQVEKPGRYHLEREMSVMQALAVGGGVTQRGSERGIQLKRNNGGNIETSAANLNDKLLPNDVIYIKESIF